MEAYAIFSKAQNAFLRNYRDYRYHWSILPTLFDDVEEARKCLSGIKSSNTYRARRGWGSQTNISDAKIVEIGFVMGTKDLK